MVERVSVIVLKEVAAAPFQTKDSSLILEDVSNACRGSKIFAHSGRNQL